MAQTPHLSEGYCFVLTSPWTLTERVAKQYVSCNSKSFKCLCPWPLPRGPGSLVWPAGSACCLVSKRPPLGCCCSYRWSCSWTCPRLAPPPPAAGLCFQAVVAQLSAALLHCFRLCFSVLSKWFAWPPRGYLPCFSSALSSCSVFFWYPFSPVVCPLVFIFWVWGFDTCKVTLRHCLVVDSLILMLFCSLGSPGGTLDKMCSIMYCRDINFFLIGREKGRMFLLWTGLPSSALFDSPHLSNGCSLDMVVLR